MFLITFFFFNKMSCNSVSKQINVCDCIWWGTEKHFKKHSKSLTPVLIIIQKAWNNLLTYFQQEHKL